MTTSTLSTPVSGLRRAPVQSRSAARVQRMLDAAGELVRERGYEATTTSLIARRARVSIGSLYQFFPDKKAIVRALAHRQLDEFVDRLRTALQDARLDGWPAAVDLTLEVCIDAYRTLPGFAGFGDSVDPHLLDPRRHNHEVLADRLVEVVGSHYDGAADAALRTTVLVAVVLGDALLELAFRAEPGGDETILQLLRPVICDHLARHLDAPRAGGAGRSDGRKLAELGP